MILTMTISIAILLTFRYRVLGRLWRFISLFCDVLGLVPLRNVLFSGPLSFLPFQIASQTRICHDFVI